MPRGGAGHGGQGRQVSAGCTSWRCAQSPASFSSLPFPCLSLYVRAGLAADTQKSFGEEGKELVLDLLQGEADRKQGTIQGRKWCHQHKVTGVEATGVLVLLTDTVLTPGVSHQPHSPPGLLLAVASLAPSHCLLVRLLLSGSPGRRQAPPTSRNVSYPRTRTCTTHDKVSPRGHYSECSKGPD